MATTELKTLEKLIKEILEKVQNIGEQNLKNSYEETVAQISTKLDTIDERISAPDKNDTISAELISKVDEINKKIEKNSKKYLKEIQQIFDNYKQNQAEFLSTEEYQNSDIKDFVSVITTELSELRENFENFNTEFTDISLNTNMTISKEIISLKNYVLALSDTADNVKKQIEEYSSEAQNESVQEIYTSTFNTFKNDVYAVLAKITDASNNVIKQISEIYQELKTFEGLELSVGEIIQNQHKNKAEILKIIHNNIEEENKKLLPQIMQLVNSINFDESAEEIKDGLYAVNENLGIVNKNIETGSTSIKQIAGQIEDITNNVKNSNEELTSLVKNDLVEKLSQMNVFLSDVSNDFEVLTKGTKGDTDTYIYSLLDLEADISKVRVIMDELNHTIQDDRSLAESVVKNISDKISNLNSYVEKTSMLYTSPDYKEILVQFEALNDDITSISKRTNKLILTSDDSSEKLQNNIKTFQNIMVKISETVKDFENSSILKNISAKAENIQKLLVNSINSDKAINEAFVYLANWIDSTSEEIKIIKEETAKLNENIKQYANSKETKEEPYTTIEKQLNELNKRLSENTKRIDMLEEKIDNIHPADNSQLITSMEYIAGQIQIINDNLSTNKTINKKIDKMEKQIQQLLSFVEEE